MQITLEIPDELASILASSGKDLSRAALEAISLEAYRQQRLSAYQLRTLLGIPSRFELDAFLKERRVYDYTTEDFEKDFASLHTSREKPKVDKSA